MLEKLKGILGVHMFNKGVIRKFLFSSLGFGFIIGIIIGIAEESKKAPRIFR
ncbi:hypothetical protein [Clostridium chromiireducens]|uniref:hypothetical protein n=1 Tax=Clostridium chromiireducens TaxID=225345 RepID=UPI001A9BA442|nr:hypothetical protein [Clostridium chromiireducens]